MTSDFRPLELWGGVECTVNRVGDAYHDQLALTGHDRRPADLDRIAALGIRRLRYPVLWERIAPVSLESADWTWADIRLAALHALGIAPIAGLVHHGSGPRYATLLDPHFPDALAAYASAVAQHYPWIDAYTPVNEPLTTARFCALYGHWFPHQSSDATFVRALLHECRGTVLAMRAIRAINPSAILVQTDDAGLTRSTGPLAYQAAFDSERRWLGWDLIGGCVDRHHPMWGYLLYAGATEAELAWFLDHRCPPDIVGLNYYVTSDRFLDDRTERHPGTSIGGNGRHRYADVEAVRVCGGIAGHEAVLLEAWARYRRPVALTEVHLGCSREEQMRWLIEAWRGAQRAREAGADVRATTAWALLGLSDWNTLLTRLDGHYEPGAYDVRGSTPRLTALGRVIADLATARTPEHPATVDEGWWRPRSSSPSAPSARRQPILITGAGTLGRACARICERRGLAHVLLTHADLDITDVGAAAHVFEDLRPWAIVNTAGYVRVDDAEHDADQCAEINILGPSNLADLCAPAKLPLVTFSSDLVFDGASSRPYVEDDPVNPLSVYGRTKMEAERRVLDIHPDALVVRTAAFFGPWDRWNAVHLALDAFASGIRWKAARDLRVSPTYVPDLVDAVLDLLIDGATGVWHLANEGDVSWAELALKAGALFGHHRDLVEECLSSDLGLQATRPHYSVLASHRGQLLRPLDDALRRFAHERMRSV